jgi:hypothetical protein
MNQTLMTDLAHWLDLRARVEPAQLSPGGKGKVVVEADIPSGGHIESNEPPEPFLIPTVLAVQSTPDVLVGSVRYPAAVERRFDWSPAVLQIYHGRIRFEATIEIAAGASAGLRTITAELSYQACINGACLPPNSQAVDVAVEIGSPI